MANQSCEIEFRVRYPEADRMGVVHHAQYPIYFEMGRTELLRKTGFSYRQMEESGSFFVVSKLEVQYKAPARYDEILRLVTQTTKLTRVRIEHEYYLYRKDENGLLTKGHTILVCVNREGKVIPIPDYFFKLLDAEPEY